MFSMSHRNDAGTQTHGKRIPQQDGHDHSSTKPSSFTQNSGQGLLESVYRTCLTHELRKAGQQVVAEQLVPIVYDGHRTDDGYRLDMLVNDAVIVEIKTVERLLPVHQAQLLSYLKLLDKRLGLLLNFKVPQVDAGREAHREQLLIRCVVASSR